MPVKHMLFVPAMFLAVCGAFVFVMRMLVLPKLDGFWFTYAVGVVLFFIVAGLIATLCFLLGQLLLPYLPRFKQTTSKQPETQDD